MGRLRRLVVAAAALLLCVAQGFPAQSQSERRIALVIGNAAYKDAPLKNPVNDARLMAARLKALGFEVIARENATREQLGSAIVEFAGKLTPETAALIYYAGHGIQSRGRNYIVPVDATLGTEYELRFQAVDVGALTEAVEQAQSRVSFLILDACRNNPFERRMRGSGQGLAAVDAARGALIAYATAPGSVAADGDGQNGTYTEELAKVLTVPNLKAEEVFKRVTAAVEQRTKGQQTPWISSSLRGDFIFNLTVNVAPAATPPTGAAACSPPAAFDREALFWQSIQSSTRAADFEAYLAQFPKGTFAALAKNRLDELKKPQLAAAPAPGAAATAAPPVDAAPKAEIAIEPVDKPYVTNAAARVRETPNLKAAVLATLKEGEAVHVLGKVKGQAWYQIERKGQAPGYVAASLLDDQAAPAERSAPAATQQAMAAPSAAAPSAAAPAGRVAPIDYDAVLRRVADLAQRTADSLPGSLDDSDRSLRFRVLGTAICHAGDLSRARGLFARAESEANRISRSYDATWLKVAKMAELAEGQAECGDPSWRQTLDRTISMADGVKADTLEYRYEYPARAMVTGGEFERAFAYVDRSGNARFRANVRQYAIWKFMYRGGTELAESDRLRAIPWGRDGLTIARGLCGTKEEYVNQSIGTAMARLGDTDGAARAVDCLTDANNKSWVQFYLAEALVKAGDKARARSYLQEALLLARSISTEYGQDDSKRAAVAGGFAKLGDLAAADAAIQQIARGDKREDAYANVAFALIEAGDRAAANRYIDPIAGRGRGAFVLSVLGKKLQSTGDGNAARQAFARSAGLAEQENDNEQHYYLALAAQNLREAGQAGLAERVLARGRQLVEQVTDRDKRNGLASHAVNYVLAGDVELAMRMLEFMAEPARRHHGVASLAKKMAEEKRKPQPKP